MGPVKLVMTLVFSGRVRSCLSVTPHLRDYSARAGRLGSTVLHLLRFDLFLSRNKQKKDIQCILTKINTDSFTKDGFHGDYVVQPTLEQVLTNKRSFAAFSSFLRSEFSEENIEFWKECKDYRERTPLADLPSKAAEIWLAFLQPLAPREVNIDHDVREQIKRSLVSPGRYCFDEALTQVYWLMERDSYPRFLKAEAGQTLRRKSRHLW